MPAAHQQVALPERYRVVRHVANGGMASVWAAEDSLLERLVAVKVLAPGYAADPTARRRFTREARAAARVSDHQHVVTIFDIGDFEGQAFIVMEHLAGGTVAERLKADEPIPVPLALQWLSEAASALDAAHAADIVHRDVKPGNLLLDDKGRLAVGDFGIASIAGETQVTQAGQVLGTAAYLSPEQARGRPATPASDRYSLAVVAYELLCGKRPFDGDTPVAQARAHVEVEPPEPVGPCSAAADALRHGLAKDPDARPETAAAFVAELEDGLRRSDVPTEATTVLPPRTARVAGPIWAEQPRFSREERPEAAVRRTPTPPPLEPVARRRPGAGRALWAGVLLLLCLAGGAAAALISDNGNDGGTAPSTSAHRASAGSSAAPRRQHTTSTAAKQPSATSTPATSTPAPPSTDGRSAAALNDAGFSMLPGNPSGAVPLLQQAVAKFRAAGDRSSITYAYALYNLGWALRLSGHPADAIPYLQERLSISDYKRGVVEQELRTAQQQAGQAPTGGGKKPKGKGKKDKGPGNGGFEGGD